MIRPLVPENAGAASGAPTFDAERFRTVPYVRCPDPLRIPVSNGRTGSSAPTFDALNPIY